MEPPSLPRTVSPIWSDIPAYAGDAEQMEEYLSGELTRYFDIKSFWHHLVLQHGVDLYACFAIRVRT